MRQTNTTVNTISLNNKYDLGDIIQSRYDESSGLFNLPIDTEVKQVTIFNPRAGASITLRKGKQLFNNTKLMSFKGKTLYLWDHFPIPAQMTYEGCKKMCSRYRGISIQFN